MWLVAPTVLLLGGVAIGFALARRHRRGVLVAALILPVGLSAAFLVPGAREIIQCRIGGGFWAKESHPPELVGVWVGWDTSHPTPYCRLELAAEGTGTCAFWYQPRSTGIWRVSRWTVSGNRIEVSVENGDRREEMQGEIQDGALSLRYFGSDGPEVTKNWFGPLHLVPEETEQEAKEAIRHALSAK